MITTGWAILQCHRIIHLQPILKPGFDAGFHSFDAYAIRMEDTRFFQFPALHRARLPAGLESRATNSDSTYPEHKAELSFGINTNCSTLPGRTRFKIPTTITIDSIPSTSLNKRWNTYFIVPGKFSRRQKWRTASDSFLTGKNPA
jgi:hypothetical protein